MCSLIADETDTGMEAPATGLAPESVGCIGVVYGSRLFCTSLAALDRWASERRAPLWTMILQAGLSDAAFSQVVTSMLKSLR